MKKSGLILLFVFILVELQAQEQGGLRIQAGGDYRLTIKELGSHLGLEYFFADRFALSPNFTVWFPDQGNSFNLNADLRYYLSEGVSQLYVLAGYSNYWINPQPGNPGVLLTRPGGNIGVGAFIKATERFGFNTEFKFQTQNSRWPVFRVGAVYMIN